MKNIMIENFADYAAANMRRHCWLPKSGTFSSNRVPPNGSRHGEPAIGGGTASRMPVMAEATAIWASRWTGVRGWYCLAHAGYGRSNNIMGVEVD